MFFRVAALIGILTAIALMAISLEKQNLSLKRRISWQHYQLQHLEERLCREQLRTHELGGPARLLQAWQSTHPQPAIRAAEKPRGGGARRE